MSLLLLFRPRQGAPVAPASYPMGGRHDPEPDTDWPLRDEEEALILTALALTRR